MIFNQDRLRRAREAGYSDDEIWEYASSLDQRMRKARDAGYSLEEVSSFFTPKEEEQAGLLPPVEEMFKPKPKEVGTFEGIANAARNAFASSQQALAVTGGVTPEEAKEISKIEFEKNARQVSPDYKEYQEAQGFDAVKAFARNPFEVTTNIVAEGLAGSLPALGAGLAAGGVGAAVAAPTVVGAPVGFLAGQVAGTFAGSLATEYGGKVLEELQGAGMDINNPDSITEFFSKQELVDAAKEKALKRGVPIAAFDALSAGIGGKVGAITKAAFKTKTREAAAEMAVQAALGGGGEVAGSLVAGDKVDPKAVFAEVVGEVGPGAAEIGIGKIQQTFAERRKQEQIKRAAKVSQDLENNNAPLTADALKTTVAKNAIEEEKATIEETDTALAEEAAKFAPPEDAITKQELKTQYSALSPEDLTDTEATFRERLDDEDPEMRTFAQNALDAIAEVRAEQARARKLPTDVLPTETPGATYGREADIYDVFADIRRRPMPPSGPAFESAQVIEEAARRADILRRTPEGRELLRRELQGEEMVGGVRRATEEALATAPEPAEGDVFAEIRRPSRAEEAAITIEQQLTEDERIRRSQLGAEALREELAQVESLSRVADNTATDEEVVRLARQGLVNIQDGQNVITPRGEEVMQRGGAPLPRLTPEERAAEVAAAPTPTAIVEQAPAPKAPVPEDKTATIFNYEEKVAPIQERIDNKIDELVAGGMTFEQADNDPSVMALLEERLAVDRGAVNSYRNIVRTAFSEQGITQNDLTFNPAESIIEKVYAAPRTGDEGLIALISERGQEAFADDEATVKKLAEAIFKYRAEAEGFSPEELLGPRSNLTDAGKQSRVDEARSQAQSIHNKIKASLIEGTQPIQPVQPAALPARAALPAPTPITTPPVTEAVTPAPAAPTPAVPAEAAPVGIAVGEPAEVAPPTKAEQPVIDPIGYGNALIDLFPTLKAAGVRAISMEESLADIERKWQQKQKSGKATRIDKLVYLANKKNTEDALAGNRVGGTWSRTDLRVAVSSSATPSAMAHEIGHAIMEIEFSKADKKTRDAIEAEYTKWFKEKYGKEGTPSVADQKRIWEWMEDSDWLNPKAPTPLEFRNPNWERYRSSFGEWFADEVAKWATTREKPKSLIDKFFSELAAKLSRLWNAVSENFSPNETLASWLDSITVASPSKVDPVTEGFQVGSRVGNKNARFLTYTIVEALPQNEAEKRNNERSYRVRDKKGKVTTMGSNDLVPLQERLELLEAAPEPTPAPEAAVEEAPAERPKRRTKMQNIIDISTGVKRPKTKLTVNEMTALKDQIKMRARRRREDKRSQREFAEELTKEIREMTIRGKVRPAQLRVIMSKALRTQFDNEASINGFTRYVDKVIENANYEKDLSSARAAIKEAQRLAKQKTTPGNISRYLSGFTAIDPRDIEPDDMSEREVDVDGEIVREKPVSLAEFSAVLREYMKAAGPVEAKDYTVIPDTEIADFLSKLGEQVKKNQEDQEKAAFAKRLEKALENKALLPAELDAVLNNSAKEYEDYLAKKQEDRRKKVENAINSLAEEAQIALAKYDNPEMDDNEKSILDFMKRVTLSDMSIGNRKNYIRIANNILVNNKFFGSEKFSSIAKGQIGALEASQDSKKIKRNSALIKAYNLIFRENLGPEISLGMQSFADTMRNITRPEEGVRLLYQMGFGDLERGRAASNEAKRKFTEAVEPNFKRIEEKTGQKINDSQGLVSSGVAATLIQIHPDETEAEGIQRMRGLIESDIERKKNSWKKEDRKTAILVEKALNEVYADSIEGILQNLKNTHPANYEVLTFLMNTVLPSYKPLFKKHDEMFNNQSDNYENPYYLPIRYRRISTEPVDPSEGIGNRMEGVASPKQSPNSIKRVKNSALPENMQFDYNLVKNVIDSVSSQLDATYMNPGLQQVHSFLTSEYATKALGGAENVEVVRKRINSLVESRDRRAYDMTGWSRVFDTFANGLRNVGTTMLLGGIGQLPKQVPAQMLGTVINVNDKDITSTAVFETKAALPVLRQFSIGERGEIAGGARWISQLDTGYSKLERYIEDGVWSKIKDAMENLANVWLYGLKKGDSFAAAHGWISYYKKYLKDNDMPFTNWDNEARLVAEGDRGRVQAGLYADTQVDLYQGASDPTKMATFAQRGKTGAENMMKTIFLPFSSFAIQERTRFLTDLRDVLYGDAEEKKKATKGLMATISGIVTFHWVRRYALPAMFGYLAYGLYGLLGVEMDEPDEEEEKEKDARTFRKFLGEIAANITVGGYSSIAENALIDSVNYMAYQYDKLNETENALNDDGDVISWDKYRKERAPFYRYTGPGADVSLGMVGVIPDQLKSVQEKLANLSDEELMDSLTDEEKRVLILAGVSDILYSLRLNDADVARMMNRMSDEIKKQAEERKKAQRRLQRLYGQ